MYKAVDNQLCIFLAGYSDLENGCKEYLVASILEGSLETSIRNFYEEKNIGKQPHSYLIDKMIRKNKGKGSYFYLKNLARHTMTQAHKKLLEAGIITSTIKWRMPTGMTEGKTRNMFLSDDFYNSLITELTANGVPETFFKKFFKNYFRISKEYNKARIIASNDANKEYQLELLELQDKETNNQINIGSSYFGKLSKKIMNKIKDEDTTKYICDEVKSAPHYTYHNWLEQRRITNVDSNREVVVVCESYLAIVEGNSEVSDLSQTYSGRVSNALWSNIPSSLRAEMVRGMGVYNFDLAFCQLVIVAQIIGANKFLDNIKELNGGSLWVELLGENYTKAQKDEIKEGLFSSLFLANPTGEKRIKREKGLSNPFLADYLPKLKAFNSKHRGKVARDLLIDGGKNGTVVNALGMRFLPAMKSSSYMHEGEKRYSKKHSNITGKYLAFLATGIEQAIIQEIYTEYDGAFAYQYDGFFFKPTDGFDMINLELIAKKSIAKYCPAMTYKIEKID